MNKKQLIVAWAVGGVIAGGGNEKSICFIGIGGIGGWVCNNNTIWK